MAMGRGRFAATHRAGCADAVEHTHEALERRDHGERQNPRHGITDCLRRIVANTKQASLKFPKLSADWTAGMSYATGEGGGRCWRAWPESRPRAADLALCAMLTSSMGGATGRLEGCTKPLELMLPNVIPQWLLQDWLENDGPAAGFACAGQQRFARMRQQDAKDGLTAPAARGASEATDTSTARHAAITLRAQHGVSFLLSISCRRIPRTTARTPPPKPAPAIPFPTPPPAPRTAVGSRTSPDAARTPWPPPSEAPPRPPLSQSDRSLAP